MSQPHRLVEVYTRIFIVSFDRRQWIPLSHQWTRPNFPIVCCGRLFTSDKRLQKASQVICVQALNPLYYLVITSIRLAFLSCISAGCSIVAFIGARHSRHMFSSQVLANTEALTEAVCSLWPRYGTGLSSHFQRASSVMSFFLAALLRPEI